MHTVALQKADPWWEVWHALADSIQPGLIANLVVALAEPARYVAEMAFVYALYRRHATDARTMLETAVNGQGTAALHQALLPPITSLMTQAAALPPPIPGGIATPPPFSIRDPARITMTWQGRIGRLLTTTKEALGGIVRRALDSVLPLQAQAKEILALVGLTEREAKSVAKYRQGLEETQASEDHILMLVQRRAEVLREQRAARIADAEAMAAITLARQWRMQAAVSGGMVMREVRKRWVLTDERQPPPCAECKRLARQYASGIPLEAVFVTAAGEVIGPPGHAHCRCMLEYFTT